MSECQAARVSVCIEAGFYRLSASLFRFQRGFVAVDEGPKRDSQVHASALLRALLLLGAEPLVERLLHLAYGIEPGLVAFDAEVFIERNAVEAFDCRPATNSGLAHRLVSNAEGRCDQAVVRDE